MTTSYETSLKMKELNFPQEGGEYYWTNPSGGHNEQYVTFHEYVRPSRRECRAFTLGELVRMLPKYFSISAIPNDFYITSYTAHVHNTSPEEAAAELAMELVGSGVIKFETNQKEVSNG